MKSKQERLLEVYAHVRAHHGVHTKTEMAERLHMTQPAFSAAINGKESYLTKNLFQKINGAFPGVFNLDYLLTGQGHLLTVEEEAKSSEIEKAASPSTDDLAAQYSNMLELYARMIRGVDDLRQELKSEVAAAVSIREQVQKELAEVQTLKSDLQQARDDFRDATYRLTQALSKLGNSHPSNIGLMAAEDYSKPQEK